jgi:hypothetical protein
MSSIAPADLRAIDRVMRQVFPQRPKDCPELKKLRMANRAKFEDWQRRQVAPAT